MDLLSALKELGWFSIDGARWESTARATMIRRNTLYSETKSLFCLRLFLIFFLHKKHFFSLFICKMVVLFSIKLYYV